MKQVKINNIVNVYLIPQIKEYEKDILEKLWWNSHELKKFSMNYITEINVIIKLKNISFNEAKKFMNTIN
jgi:hypothetical protein|tara:strand:+ start:972 stop:1181 length:210 start_codon:yes stop_codon:yes gene_type:complete